MKVSQCCEGETELQGRRDSAVQTDLFCDLVVPDMENGRATESRSLARRGRKNADKKITVGRARMRAAADPASDHMVSLSHELCRG